MITLYDSPFSPFARKVRMILEFKGLEFEAVDALLKQNHAALQAVNEYFERALRAVPEIEAYLEDVARRAP